jgi:dihydrofolate reductase
MRKLAVVEYVTLDGVLQGPSEPEEDTEGGFAHGGWGAPYSDEIFYEKAMEALAVTTAYLMGRKTYDLMADYWPHQPDENPLAVYFNGTPKYVVSKTHTRLDWAGSQFLPGDDVPAGVRALKAEGEGVISLLGSSALLATLTEHDLIDEYRLFVHPVIIGSGKRLFRSVPSPVRMRLVDCTRTSTDVLMVHYQRE